jgi:hypothetical protein
MAMSVRDFRLEEERLRRLKAEPDGKREWVDKDGTRIVEYDPDRAPSIETVLGRKISK